MPLLLRKKYSFADFSKYNSKIGTNWGRGGVPEEVKREGQKHQVKTISLIISLDNINKAYKDYALILKITNSPNIKNDDKIHP